MLDNKMFGKVLKTLRFGEEKTIQQLAADLNISPAYISKLENGHGKPTIQVLEKYASHFGIKVSDIIFWCESQNENDLKLKAHIFDEVFKNIDADLAILDSKSAKLNNQV